MAVKRVLLVVASQITYFRSGKRNECLFTRVAVTRQHRGNKVQCAVQGQGQGVASLCSGRDWTRCSMVKY